MLTLYEHPLSPYAQKVKIALREKGVAFDLVLPTGIGTGDNEAAFAKASPRGEVPVLVDDDTAIFDSTIILEYIEDRWPDPSLKAVSPAGQARARMIEDAMDTHFEAINWGLGELKYFGRASGDLRQTIETNAERQTRRFFGWIERQLGENDWLTEGGFGWADLSTIPYIIGSIGFGIAPEDGSPLSAWVSRVSERPSVAQTLEEAAASIAGMEQAHQAVEAGLFKREYRDHRLEWMIKSGGLEVVIDGLRKDNIRFTPEFSAD